MRRVLVLVVLVFTLTACGSDSPTVQDAEAHVTATFEEKGSPVTGVYCREEGERFECEVDVKLVGPSQVYVDKADLE